LLVALLSVDKMQKFHIWSYIFVATLDMFKRRNVHSKE
jgi:hypothetical protein